MTQVNNPFNQCLGTTQCHQTPVLYLLVNSDISFGFDCICSRKRSRILHILGFNTFRYLKHLSSSLHVSLAATFTVQMPTICTNFLCLLDERHFFRLELAWYEILQDVSPVAQRVLLDLEPDYLAGAILCLNVWCLYQGQL